MSYIQSASEEEKGLRERKRRKKGENSQGILRRKRVVESERGR